MFVQVLLVCTWKGSNFFPSGGIFFPVILKWLFLIDFYMKHLVVTIYCMFDHNMINNFKLYHAKGLILALVNGKWIKNVMRIAICYNDLNVKKIILLLLLDLLFNLLLLLLIINQRVMVYFVPKWSYTPQLLSIYIVFSATIENGAWKHYHSQTIYTQLIFIYLRPIFCNFVGVVSCTMLDSWIHNECLDDCQYFHHSMIIVNEISYDVCIAILSHAKLITHVALSAITMHRCWEVIYFAIIRLVYWLMIQYMMDQLKTNIGLQRLFNIVLNIWQHNYKHFAFTLIIQNCFSKNYHSQTRNTGPFKHNTLAYSLCRML